jgi:hypothetical protein
VCVSTQRTVAGKKKLVVDEKDAKRPALAFLPMLQTSSALITQSSWIFTHPSVGFHLLSTLLFGFASGRDLVHLTLIVGRKIERTALVPT